MSCTVGPFGDRNVSDSAIVGLLESGLTPFPRFCLGAFVEHGYWGTQLQCLRVQKYESPSHTTIDIALCDVESFIRIRHDEEKVFDIKVQLHTSPNTDDVIDLKESTTEWFHDIAFDGVFIGTTADGGGVIHFIRGVNSMAYVQIEIVGQGSKPIPNVVTLLKKFGARKVYTSLKKHLASST